eukprot:TRINITY_DN41182_c0_g1_i1.p1 TRINITY_DN41182_c0_g1~~TRINITY_DN41182_c0_g1_i1.p1  ORF type:complete len:367 (-),score=53.98 TRINITY_DN41182_c0_g1_i1:115-1215(-)
MFDHLLGGGEEPVTTVHILNIPADVTLREFNCWFILASGFQDGKLKARGPGQPQMGWATFGSHDEALACAELLNNKQLSEVQATGCPVLTAQLAKQNSRVSKRPLEMGGSPQQSFVPRPRLAAPQPYRPQYATDSGSNTLFVHHLAPPVSEGELVEFFGSNFEGFDALKFTRERGTCFVRFHSPGHAGAALEQIASGLFSLPSNPGKPVEAERARTDSTFEGVKWDGSSGKGASWNGSAGKGSGGNGGKGHFNLQAPIGGSRAPPPPPVGVAAWCDTMYVGGMDHNTTEEELTMVVQYLEGFVRMKFLATPGKRPTAWVLFESPQQCADAIGQLDQMALPSHPSTPVAFQFAKATLDSLSNPRQGF